ncbi:MAG: hypothetical protein UY76_C0013G0006 [Candidatus Uhrbacteria bacterium GW2011_GWA2_52_8d]|uniref:Uncharacterized protein n=1 Tax=Candidatus Uhrbacteria bacterium GW2011_GWA2_52_8d TaxID=1618979 RepID=A0A0G1XNS0_9BACT|nr:MAG: hypothetical protein UY76_C0013G0006 [Candidatus Uhrbacteria bacterium GW2011_GWA2_52_8d]
MSEQPTSDERRAYQHVRSHERQQRASEMDLSVFRKLGGFKGVEAILERVGLQVEPPQDEELDSILQASLDIVGEKKEALSKDARERMNLFTSFYRKAELAKVKVSTAIEQLIGEIYASEKPIKESARVWQRVAEFEQLTERIQREVEKNRKKVLKHSRHTGY